MMGAHLRSNLKGLKLLEFKSFLKNHHQNLLRGHPNQSKNFKNFQFRWIGLHDKTSLIQNDHLKKLKNVLRDYQNGQF